MRAPEVSMASKSAALYNPPVKPQRAFDLDYPKGAPTDAAGKLTHTIDGDPITAKYVVGRTAAGGADVALPREALDEIAKALTGSGIHSASPGEIGGGRVGRYAVTRGADGPERDIAVLRTLDQTGFERVAAHEVGHAIDDVAGKINGADRIGVTRAIPQAGLKKGLSRVYNDLNTFPADARMPARASAGLALTRQMLFPSNDGKRWVAVAAARQSHAPRLASQKKLLVELLVWRACDA